MDDDFGLGVRQEKNWPYFIERMLEASTNLELENIVGAGNPEKIKIINFSLQNLTICKEFYKNLRNSVADNLREYFNQITDQKLNETDKDLRLNYFFIDFNNQYNS